MKSKVVFTFLLLSVFLITRAQKNQPTQESQETSKRFLLKLNYSNVNSHQIIPDYYSSTASLKEFIYKKNPQFNFEGLYRINKIFSLGAYFGYSNGTFISNKITELGDDYISVTRDKFGYSLFYGLTSNIQLLPLFLKTENLRLNVYCPIRIGLVSQHITNLDTYVKTWDTPVLEFGAGLGLSYNFTKNLAIFGEYQFGHFYNFRNSQWKVGLAVKF